MNQGGSKKENQGAKNYSHQNRFFSPDRDRNTHLISCSEASYQGSSSNRLWQQQMEAGKPTWRITKGGEEYLALLAHLRTPGRGSSKEGVVLRRMMGPQRQRGNVRWSGRRREKEEQWKGRKRLRYRQLSNSTANIKCFLFPVTE